MRSLPAVTCAILMLGLLILGGLSGRACRGNEPERPNIILVVCDNLGYGDVGCFGSQLHRTPALDRMAADGMRLTHFYSTSGVCTPSRASIMTGCYPRRVGMHSTDPDGIVLRPVSPNGLHPDERTIAEVLREAGYATCCIGKWHLGDQPPFLPTRQGFDFYFGIPYSDDMTPREGRNWPPLPLMENERVIEAPVDRHELTRRYTEQAIAWMLAQGDQPFFLYLPQAMPGSTRAPFASEAFRGRSQNGAYGDSVEELDWSMGEIRRAVEAAGLAEETLMIWTSDNGAPRRNPAQGSNAPLGGWGYTTQEGGMRVPCIAWWPGRVPAGTTMDRLTTTMDLLPTVAALAGVTLPADHAVDGHDIRSLLLGDPDAESPYEAFYYYQAGTLEAVRSGQWKLRVRSRATRNAPAAEVEELYDVVSDPGETRDVAADQAQIVARLQEHAAAARRDLGDGERSGIGVRSSGRVADPRPQELVEPPRR